jgi:hypothetical protein
MANAIDNIAVAVVVLSIGCAVLTALDLLRHPQRMWIMNLVWPLTALYAGPIGLWAYAEIGRNSADRGSGDKPFWQTVLVGATHCGAGCALGDFAGDWLVHGIGLRLFGSALAATCTAGFVLAYLVGIFFQYFSIAPMRGLAPLPGLLAAVKADTLSLVAYEIGMLGWMVLVQLWLAPGLEPSRWSYWLSMQAAMLLGFATTYPVNWWLIRADLKEAM